jgi:hypothetical protein
VRTIANPIEGSEVRVEPKQSPGISINGVAADLEHVSKADVRVDLLDDTRANDTRPDDTGADDTRADGTRAFVVEHVLGPLGLYGITAAEVVGIREEWDFARPEHRFAYATDAGPASVVGHPAGLPNPELAEALGRASVVRGESEPRQTVSQPVSFEAGGGEIQLRPAACGDGIEFDVQYEDASISVQVDPRETADDSLIDSVAQSTTPYLSPTDEEAVTHSVADLVSDIAVLGGFDDLVVDVTLAGAYHALTVGAARRAHEDGVVTFHE